MPPNDDGTTEKVVCEPGNDRRLLAFAQWQALASTRPSKVGRTTGLSASSGVGSPGDNSRLTGLVNPTVERGTKATFSSDPVLPLSNKTSDPEWAAATDLLDRSLVPRLPPFTKDW